MHTHIFSLQEKPSSAAYWRISHKIITWHFACSFIKHRVVPLLGVQTKYMHRGGIIVEGLMKAMVLEGPGKLVFKEVPIPKIGPRERPF